MGNGEQEILLLIAHVFDLKVKNGRLVGDFFRQKPTNYGRKIFV